VFTPRHVARNVDGTCLIICGSTSKSFGHMSRRRLWYVEPDAISNAVGYAKFFSRSHDAVIRVCDEASNVIETHEEAGEFKASIKESLPCHPSRRCENETVDLPMLFVM